MKVHYYINLVKVGRTIEVDVLIEESALNDVNTVPISTYNNR